MEIVISGSLANCNNLKTNELLEFIRKKEYKFDLYTFKPTPGKIYAASIDWKTITRIGSIASILSILWMAYTELVKPKNDDDSDSGIIIRIENMEINNYFWIGKDIKSEKELFEKVNKLLNESSLDSIKTKRDIDNLKESQNWKKY